MLKRLKWTRNKIPWETVSRWANIWWVISLIILVLWWISLVPRFFETTKRVQEISAKLEQDEAEYTLTKYFIFIEQGELERAYEFLSQDFKNWQASGFTWFSERLQNFIAFEGIKVTPVENKNSASSKVFLVEFWFKKRGMKPVQTKRGMYLRFKEWVWEINSVSKLYENWRKDREWACSYYQFEHCKK